MTNNPLKVALAPYRIILASGSPRRKQFFEELGINYEVILKPVQEVYPQELTGAAIAVYLAELKSKGFPTLKEKELLITADTIVWHNETSLAKPANTTEAVQMLQQLSNDWHEVITAVCFTTRENKRTVYAKTRVKFKLLSEEEIRFYVETYQPFDKAGGYGIQDWLGIIGIEEIQGSYTNVVGLPTHLVYKTLKEMID